MGIVLKQTIKGSIYSYMGIILGGINVAILFPIIFSEEQIGLINILITVSAISAQFASIGSNGIINYFFPTFNNKANAHHSFFFVISIISIIGFSLFSIFYFIWPEYFFFSKNNDSILIEQYGYLLYPLTFLTLAYTVIDTFSASTLNAVIGNLYKEVILRVNILLLCLLYFYNIIQFQFFIIAYIINMAVPVIAVFIYLLKNKHIGNKIPSFVKYQPYLRKMISVGIYYILTGLSNILATYIDKFMINAFIGLKDTGIYSITNYFGALVRIPRSSMGKIATPLIAEAIKNNDHKKLSYLFEKSTISQILVGSVIFLLIWSNINTFLNLLPPSYLQGKWVVFYISLSHLFTCFLGVGGLIVNVSKYYKYSTYSTIVLGALVVLFNFILIPLLGIVGAALATAVAKLFFVLIYLSFIQKKMKIKVFNINSLRIIPSAVIAYFICSYFQDYIWISNKWINAFFIISLRSLIALGIFSIGLKIFGFKFSVQNLNKMF